MRWAANAQYRALGCDICCRRKGISIQYGHDKLSYVLLPDRPKADKPQETSRSGRVVFLLKQYGMLQSIALYRALAPDVCTWPDTRLST
jgi:hypothetical protein